MDSAPTQPASPSADALNLDNALWRFILPFYARDGVAPASLALQDKLGVDVNILLFAIFAKVERSITLDASDIAAADTLVREWRSDVVQTLRRVRSQMKSGPSPAPSAATDRLRNRIKAAELEAEQIELALLHDWLDRQARRTTPVVDTAHVPQVVARYFGQRDTFAPDIAAALDALSQAIRDADAERPNQRS